MKYYKFLVIILLPTIFTFCCKRNSPEVEIVPHPPVVLQDSSYDLDVYLQLNDSTIITGQINIKDTVNLNSIKIFAKSDIVIDERILRERPIDYNIIVNMETERKTYEHKRWIFEGGIYSSYEYIALPIEQEDIRVSQITPNNSHVLLSDFKSVLIGDRNNKFLHFSSMYKDPQEFRESISTERR